MANDFIYSELNHRAELIKTLQYNLKMVMAVDLPELPQHLISGILEWHDSKKKLLNNSGAAGIKYPWISSHIRDNVDIANPVNLKETIPGSPWNKEFVELFPDAIPFFNNLPLINIERIVLLESTKPVPVHVDRSKLHFRSNILEPTSYRMYLRNAEKSNGFYVQSKPMREWGSPNAIGMDSVGHEHMTQPLPKNFWKISPGKWWLLDNFCTQHGADWKEGDDKVIISVQGRIDPAKHKELMNKSSNLECIKHSALEKAENGTIDELSEFVKNVNEIPDDISKFESFYKDK